MAPIVAPDGNASTQPSILTLDKSEEPFQTQVDLACTILNIDLELQWKSYISSGNYGEEQRIHTSDPRPAHTLRWLLKKLQPGEDEQCSPRLRFKAWLLLRVLLVQTPLAKVARLIKEHKFTSSLRKTLEWLYEHSDARSRPLDLENETNGGRSEASFNSAGSSSNESKSSKKRKRGDAERVDTPSQASWFRNAEAAITDIQGVRTLYLAVCNVIVQLEELSSDPEYSRGIAVEHLKFALRSSSEEAATMLGNSLYIVTQLIRKSCKRLPPEQAFLIHLTDSTYSTCAISLVNSWENRSRGRQDSSDETSNHAFRLHCMLPCLHLLDSSRKDSSSNKDVEALRDTLERLLIEHVISPYRTQCLDRRGRDQSTGELSNPLREDLVSSLKQYRFPGPEEGDLSKRTPYEAERSASKTEKHRIITFLSLLFKVALGSHPRNTPNQRKAEYGWLEELFAQLTECAAILIPHVSSTHAQRDYSRLVKWMMQHALDHNLRLSLSALKSILDQASGLFSDEGDHEDDNVDWNVISLCLLVDADVFTISDSSATRESPYGYRTPNKYLSTLFLKLTDDYLHKSSRTDQDYNFKLPHVVLPLINAYSDARDLTGFIEHWREQLDTLQKGQRFLQNPERDNPSVWEDDKLVQHVAQLADSTLTVGQMERLLKEALSGLNTSAPHATNDAFLSWANLVIIDSICAGVVQEEKLSKLSDTAQSVYSSVSELLMKPSNRAPMPRWRIWRVLATITDRWTSVDVSSTFKERAQSMMCNAFELIKRVPEWGPTDRAIDLEEELHAFGYILSFARLDDHFWDGSKFSSRQILLSAIEKLVTVMQPFSDCVGHDFFETVKLESAKPRADTPNSVNNNVESLYVQSMTYITCCSEVFSYIDETLGSKLIEQLYWCAIYQQRSSRGSTGSSIDYSLPFRSLLSCDPNDLGTTAIRSLRRFQVQQYLKVSNFGDPKFWNMGTAEYKLSFESIQSLSPRELDRGQRSQLANRVLRVLLRANISSLATMQNQLVVLTKLITIPNKSMEILTNVRESVPEESKEAAGEPILMALARKIDGSMEWSDDNTHCVKTLRRLVRSVLSYQFSTLGQQSSIEYLNSLYNQLARLLDDTYKDEGGARTTTVSSIIELSLNAYSQHRTDASGSLKLSVETLDTLRQHHLEIILKTLEQQSIEHLGSCENRHYHSVNLECLVGYSELLTIHPRLREITSRLSNNVPICDFLCYDEAARTPTSKGCNFGYVAVRLARLELMLGTYDFALSASLISARKLLDQLHVKRYRSERDYLLSCLQDIIPKLGLQRKKELISGHDIEHKTHWTQSELLVLRIAITSLQDQEAEELRTTLSHVLLSLRESIVKTASFEESLLAMQCIDLFLRKHPRLTTQYHIEHLLSAISILATHLHTTPSPPLHLALTRLFRTILTTHRPKTLHRYHLLLLPLRSLLHCLFTPYTTPTTPSVYTPTHATAYARLITTLTDPTPSSIPSRRSLNDATKAARKTAGEYLHIVIDNYCAFQLEGRLSPGVKAALEPALFSILDVMGKGVMRMLNSALGEGERAVWKGLYEDWKRERG